MEATPTLAVEHTKEVYNTTGADIDFWIEPLGDGFPMRKGETVEIVATSDLGHEIEIELIEDAIRVHGWIMRISFIAPTGRATASGSFRHKPPAFLCVLSASA